MEGKSEIFWDYFLHELGWKYTHMDLKPEGGKTAPQEPCKRCTFPGSLCRTLVSGPVLCFLNEDFRVIPKHVTSDTVWEN